MTGDSYKIAHSTGAQKINSRTIQNSVWPSTNGRDSEAQKS